MQGHLCQPHTEAGVRRGERPYSDLSFLFGSRRFGAAVTAGELFHASGGIDELLFTREKWMTSGTNTDLNITARRARVIYHAARADDVGLIILWMNACFHFRKRARNVIARNCSRKR